MPLFLLSPAKALDESPLPAHLSSFSPSTNPKKTTTTTPRFQSTTEELVVELKKKNASQLQTLLGVSSSLASLNHKRYQEWDEHEKKCALLMFNGDAYQAMRAWEFTSGQFEKAGQTVRILSGLYGLLRPTDIIKPYRLDMSKKLMNGKGMEVFWREKISQALKEDLEKNIKKKEDRFIVNCASQEYFKAIDEKIIGYPVVTINFPGPAIYAKRGRGAFVRFGVMEEVTLLSELENFEGNDGEYSFTNKTNSKTNNNYALTFTRDASKTKKVTKKMTVASKTTSTKATTTKTNTTKATNKTAKKKTTSPPPPTTSSSSTTRATRYATRKRKQEEREQEEREEKQPTKKAKK